MFRPRTSFKNIILGSKNVFEISKRKASTSIKLEKILVVSKLSRYEYEKRKHNNLGDKELERELKARGTNFESLVHYHDLHKKFEDKVVNTFSRRGVEIEVVNRFNYTEKKVEWADIVVPIGGDGTFLLAATRVRDNNTPVIGFNSDPNRSEGHLCLPKKYSSNIEKGMKNLENGNFEWLLRSRIRTTFSCKQGDISPTYLYEIDINCHTLNPFSGTSESGNPHVKVLPVLALNEVFVGEALSARVSHLKMQFNGSAEQTSIKCSGVCICTGTGSTSWHLSINRLPAQAVAELLKLVDIDTTENKELPSKIADIYNKKLIFSPATSAMGYTIRDLISAGVWPQPKGIQSRGFANHIKIISCCFDANLVVDGGIAFPFNDGTIARLEIRPDDALRTVIMCD